MPPTLEPIEPPPDAPDLNVPDQKLLECLRERGLKPVPDGKDAWQTGLPGLRLERREVMVVRMGGQFLGHVEFVISLDHPTYGKHLIGDLVSLSGPSGTGVLAECVEVFCKMTFDPVRALFDEALFASPTNRLVSVADPGEAVAWNVYAWGIDARGPDLAVLQPRLEEVNLLGLIGGTLASYLLQPKLHWCKLYGENHASHERQFGCIFDGHREHQAVQEMAHGLNLPPGPEQWSYRGFMVLVPHGEPEQAAVDELRADIAALPPAPRPWWRFGKPEPRLMWKTV